MHVKLTDKQVLDIYSHRPLPEGVAQSPLAGRSSDLAKIFGVSPKAVRDIWHRRSWTHLTDPFAAPSLTIPEDAVAQRTSSSGSSSPQLTPEGSPPASASLLLAVRRRPGRPAGSQNPGPSRKRKTLEEEEEEDGWKRSRPASLALTPPLLSPQPSGHFGGFKIQDCSPDLSPQPCGVGSVSPQPHAEEKRDGLKIVDLLSPEPLALRPPTSPAPFTLPPSALSCAPGRTPSIGSSMPEGPRDEGSALLRYLAEVLTSQSPAMGAEVLRSPLASHNPLPVSQPLSPQPTALQILQASLRGQPLSPQPHSHAAPYPALPTGITFAA